MLVYVSLGAFVGVVVFGVLLIIMGLKGGPWKLPGIGMVVCFLALVASVVLPGFLGGDGDPSTADEPSKAVESEGVDKTPVPESEGQEEENDVTNGAEAPSPLPTQPAESAVPGSSDKFEVTEYSYKGMFSWYYFLVVKNNSGENVEIGVEANFYGADGKLVGAKRKSEPALENEHSTVLVFMPDEEYESVEYELTTEKERWYECVQSELSYEVTEAKNKIILSVTNNGSEPADFVEATVLFFNNGKLVDHAQNYATDDDAELKPGKTINKEMDCYEEFDSYQVYLTGRR